MKHLISSSSYKVLYFSGVQILEFPEGNLLKVTTCSSNMQIFI